MDSNFTRYLRLTLIRSPVSDTILRKAAIQLYLNWKKTNNDFIYDRKTIKGNIPDNLDIDNRELVMVIASRLYEQGKLSLGQAAELAGLTERNPLGAITGIVSSSVFCEVKRNKKCIEN